MAAQTDRGIPLSALSPKFLHTNSTSHTWPFSAIAELIDNAYDPDVSAKQFWIDKTRIKGLDCLTFMDNGAGMNYDKMHKMLSFGFSDKQAINGHVPVGLYGNGFKSGSMRLGKDAIVFSKTRDTMCVGLLSQTYLEAIRANHIVVPIVTFARVGINQFRALSEHAASLQDILRYSLFKTEAELFSELRAINATCSTGSSGTRIIVWNLRRMSSGQPEFEFNVNRYDIQIPADVFESTSEKYKRQERPMQSVPESDYSLRAYCSILYLKPRMQIVIRGQKVKTQLISKSLAFIAKDHYRPIFLNKRVRITFGYNTKSKEQYGIMMYHKNRLIKAYERVGCQLKANNRGVGVIGVIECNFLKPTHNKQDFDYTDEYRKTINNLGVKLEEYWNEIRYKRDREDPNCTIPVEDTMKRPDQNWVQCDNCLKWRKLPDGIDCTMLPEKWFCHMNPDPQFRNCHAEEEREDSDDDQPSYQKTYKQQERYNRMQQEKNKMQMEQAKKKVEMQRIAALAQQNEALRRQHEDLRRQLKQSSLPGISPRTIAQTPHTITQTPHTITNSARGPMGGAVTNNTPHSTNRACPGVTHSSSTMPIISSVCSLSTPSRMKRTLPLNPDSAEAKRSRLNGMHSSADAAKTKTAISVDTRPSSPVIIPDDDDIPDDNDDDDILIMEVISTPKPGTPSVDLAKVKSERRVSLDPASMHMECSDDAAVEVPIRAAAMEVPKRAAAVEVPKRAAAVEVPKRAAAVEVPIRAASVEVPIRAASVEVPIRAAAVEVPIRAATVEVPIRAASVEVPKRAAAVEVPIRAAASATASPSSPAGPSVSTVTESVSTANASTVTTVSTASARDTAASTVKDSPAVVETAATPMATSARSSPESLQQVSTTTQTNRNHQTKEKEKEKKKKEENERRKKEGEAPREGERREEEAATEEVQMEVEAVVVKMESEAAEETRREEEQEAEEVAANGEEPQAEGAARGGEGAERPPPQVALEPKDRLLQEAQRQQDQLMELMQDVAQERDRYQAQVHTLTCQVQDLETRLEELTHSVVKKELCDQAVGTEQEEQQAEKHRIYQRAKQEVEALKRELEEQEAMERADRSSRKEEVKGSDEDELALQVDALLRDLDQSNKERDELQSQLESVEEQKKSLLSQCEQLQRNLEELRAQRKPSGKTTAETPPTGEDTSNQHTHLSAQDAESDGARNLGAEEMESNGSVSPGANARTSDCADGGTPKRTANSYANRDISKRTGNPSNEGDLLEEVTDDSVRERSQNGGSRPVSPDQSHRLGTLRRNMASLLVSVLPTLYPEQANSSQLTEQVLDDFFSRLTTWGPAESCPPS